MQNLPTKSAKVFDLVCLRYSVTFFFLSRSRSPWHFVFASLTGESCNRALETARCQLRGRLSGAKVVVMGGTLIIWQNGLHSENAAQVAVGTYVRRGASRNRLARTIDLQKIVSCFAPHALSSHCASATDSPTLQLSCLNSLRSYANRKLSTLKSTVTTCT